MDHVARVDGDRRAQDFLTRRLVGVDDDPFCVSCARELLTFLYPQHAEHLQVFLHNVLYQRTPRKSEINEDAKAEPHLRMGTYNLVIGNPPGNDEYSGTNRDEIVRQWKRRFGQTKGGLMDHHCFIRRAVELARPNGGRLCLLVPEGLLTRQNRGMPALRLNWHAIASYALSSRCHGLKDNNARMAIVYLAAVLPNTVSKNHPVEVREKWRDTEKSERTTIVVSLKLLLAITLICEPLAQNRNRNCHRHRRHRTGRLRTNLAVIFSTPCLGPHPACGHLPVSTGEEMFCGT